MYNIGFFPGLGGVLEKFLADKKIKTSTKGMYFSNCYLMNVPDKLVKEIKEKFPNIFHYRKEVR